MRPDNFVPILLICLDQKIDEDFSSGINIGTERVDSSEKYSFLYTGTLAYNVSDKLGAFIEIYGNTVEGLEPSHNFDCGITYQFKSNVQVDFSLGTTLMGGTTDLFGGFGISVRLPK